MPSLTGITRPHNMSTASVPWSIKSSFVITASVLRPTATCALSLLLPQRCPTEKTYVNQYILVALHTQQSYIAYATVSADLTH